MARVDNPTKIQKNNPVLTPETATLEIGANGVVGIADNLRDAIAAAYLAQVTALDATRTWEQMTGNIDGLLISNHSVNPLYFRGLGIAYADTGKGIMFPPGSIPIYLPLAGWPFTDALGYECASIWTVMLMVTTVDVKNA